MPQATLTDLVAAAQAGRLIGFPTDTVPALACKPEAAAAIYVAKQRTLDKPLILMAADADALWPFVQGTAAAQQVWQAVADRYWPGALTLVLPKSSFVPSAVNPETPDTIGIRVPNWPLARTILTQTGPLATTSLNRSGEPPLENLAAITSAFPTVITPTTEHWQLPQAQDRVPSTVARWQNQRWITLRQGVVVL
jgi:L-threonylcarbamoyladenylate synthase